MRPGRFPFWLPVFFIPVLFFLQSSPVKDLVRGWGLFFLKPVFIAGDVVSDTAEDAFQAGARFWRAFQTETRKEERIAELEAEVRRLGEAAKENERFKKLLDFKDSLQGRRIPARVIGWDPSPWRKTILLDKGAAAGIQKDMAVMVPEGLVGRVIETGPGSARVILLTDPDARVGGVADQSRAQGVISGNGSNRLTMGYLELEGGVAVEETVLTSGVGGLFPKGIKIGRILSLSRDDAGLHLEAVLEPAVRFTKLEEVLCLASPPQG